jgi:putative inorganic carbon (HCO3(-)) transporter
MHPQGETRSSLDWLSPLIGVAAVAAGVIGALLATRVHDLGLYVLMLIGIVLLVATVWKINWGLFTLVAMTYARISDVAVHYYGAPSIAQPFIIFLAVLIFLRWILLGEKPQSWLSALGTIAAYGLVIYLSLFYAGDVARAQTGLLAFLKDAVIAILLVLLVQNKDSFRVASWGFLSTGIILGTIAVIQYLTGSFNNAYWGLAESQFMNIVSGTEGYRIMGTYGDPNFFAQVMLVIIPIALNRFLYEKKTGLKILAGWSLAVSFLTVIFTFSRGGFLALCLVLALIVFIRKPPLVAILCGILILLLLIPFLPATYFERIQTILQYLPFSGADVRNEVSLRGRMSEYAVGIQMFLDKPILGIGYENYAANYLKYSMKIGLDPRRTERSAHSLYLEVLAEQGILGLVMFGFVLYSAFKSLAKARKLFNKIALSEFADLALAFEIGFIGYLAAAIFIHGAYPRNLWLLIGTGLSAQQVARNEQIQAARTIFRQRLKIDAAKTPQSTGKL